MLHSTLCRPRAISVDLHPALHANRTILMPPKRPVGLSGLIKKNRSNRAASVTQETGGDRSDVPFAIEKRSKRVDAMNTHTCLTFRKPA